VENGGRTAIKSGIDEELDLLQERYHGLNEFLGKVAVTCFQSLREHITCEPDQLNVIYFPQLGYLISVPRSESDEDEQNGSSTDEGIESLSFQFRTASTSYFKVFLINSNAKPLLRMTRCSVQCHQLIF
jgi:DNA mismatch repair protein MSH5